MLGAWGIQRNGVHCHAATRPVHGGPVPSAGAAAGKPGGARIAHNALLAVHQQVEASVVEPALGTKGSISHWGSPHIRVPHAPTHNTARGSVSSTSLSRRLNHRAHTPKQHTPEVVVDAVQVLAVCCAAGRTVAPAPVAAWWLQARHHTRRRLLNGPGTRCLIPVLVAPHAPETRLLALRAVAQRVATVSGWGASRCTMQPALHLG